MMTILIKTIFSTKMGGVKSGINVIIQGYAELCDIVADLQKDIKRVNQCLTLSGAQAYVDVKDKDGKPIGKNWEAHEDDIKEVFVSDSKGNLKIIHGWT